MRVLTERRRAERKSSEKVPEAWHRPMSSTASLHYQEQVGISAGWICSLHTKCE